MIASLIALLSPFVQLGTSYYASVATAMLGLGMLAWWRPLATGLRETALVMVVVLFMPLSLLGAPSPDPGFDRLRLLREAAMLVLLLSATAGFRAHRNAITPPPLWLFAGLIAAYLLAAWLQTQAYETGVYLGLPREWYAQEQVTIANDLSLYYMAELLRPHATFAEPSYFAFMLLSLALMLIPRFGQSRLAEAGLLMILIAGLMSRSLSFFLSMMLVILFPIALERGRNRIGITIAMLAVAVPVIAFSGEALLSRLSSATSFATADVSTADRIFNPLYALPGYLAQYPAGNPLSIADRTLAPFLPDRTLDASDILQNALFNLLFAYGFVGMAIIAAILFVARDLRTRLYLVTCAMFNGAFLAIDKVAVIMFALAVYEANQRRAAEFEGGSTPDPARALASR